jgi:hypothetical protein
MSETDWYERLRLKEEARWREKRASLSMLLDETDAVMSPAEFADLSEYSSSLPSGTYVGKLWKCRAASGPRWLLGEYVDDATPGMIGIRWRHIHVVADPAVWLAATYGERGASERPRTAV